MDEARLSKSPSGLDGGRDKCGAYYAVEFGLESEERIRQFGARQCKRIVKQPEFVLNTTPQRESPEMIEYWWGHIDLTTPEGLASRFYAKATCIAADILGEISFKERRKITNCGLH